jgi:hypothetical protein
MKKIEILIFIVILLPLPAWSTNESDTLSDKVSRYSGKFDTLESSCDSNVFLLKESTIESLEVPQAKIIHLHYKPQKPDESDFDLGSFWGALLGAVISGIVAIGVFWQNNRRLKRTKHEEIRQTLAVFSKFIDVIEENVERVNACLNDYQEKMNSDKIAIPEWLGFPKYFPNRIRNVDVIKISKAFFEFSLTNDDCTNYIKEIEYLNIIFPELDNKYHEYNNEMGAKMKMFVELNKQIIDYLWKEDCRVKSDLIEKIKQLYLNQDTSYTYTIMFEEIMQPLNKVFIDEKIDDMKKITDEALVILKQMKDTTTDRNTLLKGYQNDVNEAMSELRKVRDNIRSKLNEKTLL